MPGRYAVKRRQQREEDRRASRTRQIRRSLSRGDNQFAMEHWKMLNQATILIRQIRQNFVLANVQCGRGNTAIVQAAERKQWRGKHLSSSGQTADITKAA